MVLTDRAEMAPSTDRIQASLMKWVAAANAFQTFAQSSPHAVFFNCLHHVHRTRRLIPAGRKQQRREPSLIDTQRADYSSRRDSAARVRGANVIHETLHFSITLASARSRSANGARIAALRGLMTTSQLTAVHSARCSRKADRNLLLMRLRVTAPPKARGTVSPRRTPSVSPPSRAKQNAANKGPDTRVP